jgi:Na+/proline symporter
MGSYLKSAFIYVILFAFCILLITPLTLIDKLSPIKNLFDEVLLKDTPLWWVFDIYFTPLILWLFNFVIIPWIIEILVKFEDFRRFSSKERAILKKNFVFTILNLIFLPITGFISITAFMNYVITNNILEIPTLLAA